MRLSAEYVFFTLALATVLAVTCIVALNRHAPAVTAPKVSFDVVRLVVVNDGAGLYLDMQATSTTNTRFCISFVEFLDPVSGAYVVAGDGTDEAANLPVCIEPGHTFKLSLYHALTSGGFPPGRTVFIKFYYSVGAPRTTTYVKDEPHHIIVPARVVAD